MEESCYLKFVLELLLKVLSVFPVLDYRYRNVIVTKETMTIVGEVIYRPDCGYIQVKVMTRCAVDVTLATPRDGRSRSLYCTLVD